MSADPSDHPELKLDSVCVEPWNDFVGVDYSGTRPSVPIAKTLTNAFNGEVEPLEPLILEVEGYEVANGSTECGFVGVPRQYVDSVAEGKGCYEIKEEVKEKEKDHVEMESPFFFEQISGDVAASCSYRNIAGGKVILGNSHGTIPYADLNQVSTLEQNSVCLPQDEVVETEAQNYVAAHGSIGEAGALKLVVDFNPYVNIGNVMQDEDMKMDSLKLGFNAYDLVWGKVRSHPWWPGQIVDPSAASDKAIKYFKRDCYLIAYFGDQTFAWNEASKIKPFLPYFSQMERRSSFEGFRFAVHCALDEVSQRVQFGLACSCVPEYKNISTHIIVNAGIREESSRTYGRDFFSSPSSFEPMKLTNYVKVLGQFPRGEVDMLQFVTARAQLLAFKRWNGYPLLPKFQVVVSLLASDAKIEQSMQTSRSKSGEVAKSKFVEVPKSKRKRRDADMELMDDQLVLPIKSKSKYEGLPTYKRKCISGVSAYPKRRKKSLADLMSGKCISVVSDSKDTTELRSVSSGKKRKADDARKHDKSLSCADDCNSLQLERTCMNGDGENTLSSQLNGTTPQVKPVDRTSLWNAQEKKTQSGRPKVKSRSLSEICQGKNLHLIQGVQADEIASQLWLMAREPTKGWCSLNSIFSFLSEFRKSVHVDHSTFQEHQKSFATHVSDSETKKELSKLTTEPTYFEPVKDSYWTDRIIQCIPEQQSLIYNHDRAGGILPGALVNDGFMCGEPQSAAHSPNVQVPNACKNFDMEIINPEAESHFEENHNADASPTALILNFTKLDCVPSKKDLNNIFSRFGGLIKSETEVLKKKNRAKVVFCRRADAEAAFSSAGKYSIFGPSLASYRLKYDVCSPNKSSP